MRLSQILFTCAVLCIAWPAATLADPPEDQNKSGHEDHQKGGQAARPPQQGPQTGQAQRGGQGGGQGVQAGAQFQAGAQGGTTRNHGQNFGPQSQPGAQGGPTRNHGQNFGPQSQPGAQGGPTRNRGQNAGAQFQTGVEGSLTRGRGQYSAGATPQGGVQGAQTRNRGGPGFQTGGQSGQTTSRGQYGVQGGTQTGQRNRLGQVGAGAGANVRGPSGPALGGWNPSVRGAQRLQAGQQWRQQHQGFDQRAVWRGNRDWWRQDAGFSLFSGIRVGFFFIPEVGYISAPRGYWGRHWRYGEYLPRWFWRYQVRDYWRYGLPGPPPDCLWVWVNRDVALVALDDGYILDIIYNVW